MVESIQPDIIQPLRQNEAAPIDSVQAVCKTHYYGESNLVEGYTPCEEYMFKNKKEYACIYLYVH